MRDRGQRRLPEPPAIITGRIINITNLGYLNLGRDATKNNLHFYSKKFVIRASLFITLHYLSELLRMLVTTKQISNINFVITSLISSTIRLETVTSHADLNCSKSVRTSEFNMNGSYQFQIF